MLSDLNAVVASGAVDQVCFIDVDRNMMNMQPSAAFAGSAAVDVAAIVFSSARIEPRKEDQIARLELRRIGE